MNFASVSLPTASQSHGDKVDSRPRQLPSLCLGASKMRFLLLIGDNKADVQVDSDGHGVHLFLAADVLADSNILKENQPRVHARFAKKGLATKVYFQQDLKLEGIHGIANGIWFYSIQGVFRVIFEFHDRIKQLHCLHSLSELWKASIDNPNLSPSVTVYLEPMISVRQNMEPLIQSVVQEPLKPDDVCSIRAVSQENQRISTLGIEHDLTSAEMETLNVACIVSVQTDDSQIDCPEANSESWSSELLGCLTNFQKPCLDRGSKQLLHILQSIVKMHHKPSEGNSILFDILEDLTQDCVNDILNCDDWGDQTTLCIIAKWLGKEFHKYGPTISERVEEFKSKNIDHIDDLPPAGELVSHLFPPAMSCLLINWMGIIEESSEGQNKQDLKGKVKTQEGGLPKTQGGGLPKTQGGGLPKTQGGGLPKTQGGSMSSHHLYPLVQIILEFANQTLISGVAHVLFTRLVH